MNIRVVYNRDKFADGLSHSFYFLSHICSAKGFGSDMFSVRLLPTEMISLKPKLVFVWDKALSLVVA